MVSQCGRREQIPRIDHVVEVLGTEHAEGLEPEVVAVPLKVPLRDLADVREKPRRR